MDNRVPLFLPSLQTHRVSLGVSRSKKYLTLLQLNVVVTNQTLHTETKIINTQQQNKEFDKYLPVTNVYAFVEPPWSVSLTLIIKPIHTLVTQPRHYRDD